MSLSLSVAAVVLAALGSLLFSTLTYALRDLSRVRLADYLERHGRSQWLEPTLDHVSDLVFVTALGRLVANTLLVLTVLEALHHVFRSEVAAFVVSALVGLLITFFCSVALPHALAESAGPSVIGAFVRPLHGLRALLSPFIGLMHMIERGVRDATGAAAQSEPEQLEQQIEQEILSVVEEGEKEGVVDEQEREMIESVMEFGDHTAGQIMTQRPEIVGIDAGATLLQVRQAIEESGHSRLPVYKGNLDHILGILYARDLLRHLGQPTQSFDVASVMRPAFFVPETKPLRDLLRDFRLQKVHIAVVLDEYGGTAGLVTIEDILEELIGDISDEHEPVEPAMFHRIDEQTSEADARIRIDELNRLTGLNLPEDAGFETLGGFVSTTLGRIPQAGTSFEQDGVKFTVLAAEPQRVNRVKIEQTLQHAGEAEAVARAMKA